MAAEATVARIPSGRVVVAGFSQGGAVALLMLRSEKKLAGIVGEPLSWVLVRPERSLQGLWGGPVP